MRAHWVALTEMVPTLAAALGWCVYELAALRRHRKHRERDAVSAAPPSRRSDDAG